MDVLKHLEAVIGMYVLDFYIGRKWGRYDASRAGCTENKLVGSIVAGYALSKPWYVRVFKRRKLERECAFIEAACEYWLDPSSLTGILAATFGTHKDKKEFVERVVDIGGGNLGIFENKYVFEVYLVLATHDFVDDYVLKKYHGLRW